MTYKSRSISSKWTKDRWLHQAPGLRPHLPPTKRFNRQNLNAMIRDYNVVYFKPTTGSGGNSIIRIRKQNRGYQTQLRFTKTTHATKDALFHKLQKHANRRSYLLQKGIRLATTGGKPFDIRVMMQKTNDGQWINSGTFTKIGKPGVVATNYNQGGKIGLLTSTLAGAGYSQEDIRQMKDRLKQLGKAVGQCFDHHKKGFRELGLDVALDRNRKPWILEVNTRPQFYPLKQMKDKAMYRRIVSYAKQYGRKG